jgi:hypothetical protein
MDDWESRKITPFCDLQKGVKLNHVSATKQQPVNSLLKDENLKIYPPRSEA